MQVTPRTESVLLVPDGRSALVAGVDRHRAEPTPAVQTATSPPEAALGTYEGLCGERIEDHRNGCPRWPASLLLRWQRGDLVGYVEGRCKGVNVCDYCAIQAAHENARMLGLDALDDTRPQLLAIVGTGLPTEDPRPFYGGKREVMRALRDRFGRQVEYAALQEFTTGKGRFSGGLRRPHWNLFVKGVDAGDVDEARGIVRPKWCANVPGAEPDAQYVELVRDVGAAAKYVAMHFHKRDQAPPLGWKGQRFNCSRGYFGDLTRAQARTRARESLQVDREWFKVQRAAPEFDAVTVAEIVDELLARNAERVWTIKAMSPLAAEKVLRTCSGPPTRPPSDGPVGQDG